MKKYLLIVTIFLLFIPTIVFAEEDFTINSIEKLEITGETLEEADPSINGKNIDYNIRFYNEGDSIKYKLNVTNNTNDKLIIKDNIMSLSNENIKYELEIPDGISNIEKGSSKDLIISINYIKKAKEEDFVGGLYKRNDNIEFTLRNNQLIIGVANTLSNSALKVVAIALIVLCIFGIIFTKTKANNKITMILLLIASITLIPDKAEAVKELKFNMIGEIITELNPCFFDGEIVNGMKYEDEAYTYYYNKNYVSVGNNADTWKDNEYDGWGVRLTNTNSTENVTSMMCSSINKKRIKAMSGTFYGAALSNIDTFSFNMEDVIITDYMFGALTNLKNLDLSYKGGPNIESSQNMFANSSIEELTMNHYIFGKKVQMGTSSEIFYNMNKVTKIDLSYSDMSKTKEYRYMFDSLPKLVELNMSHMNLESMEVIDHLCYNCGKLETFDISDAITDSFKVIKYWFKYCYVLENINFKGINLENVTDMSYFFDYCYKLKSVDFSEFNTPKLSTMSYFLDYCTSLEYANLSNLGSETLWNVTALFYGDTKLKTVIMENYNFGLSSINLFSSESTASLEYIDFNNSDFSKIQGDLQSLIPTYGEIKNTIKKVDMKNVKFKNDMSYLFYECKNLEEVDLSNSYVEDVTTTFDMFYNCKNLKSLSLKELNFKNLERATCMFSYCESLEDITFDYVTFTKLKDVNQMFMYCKKLKTYDISAWEAPIIEKIDSMFYGCTGLEELNISNFGGNNITSMGAMLGYLDSLKKLFMNNFNFGSYQYFRVFQTDFPSLEEIEFSNIDMNGFSYNTHGPLFNGYSGYFPKLKKITMKNCTLGTSTNRMFYYLPEVETIDLSNTNLTNVTDAEGMFYYNSKLKSIKFDNVNMSNVVNLSYTFQGNSSLETLDLRFITSDKITSIAGIISFSDKIKKIDLSNMDLHLVTRSGSNFYAQSLEELVTPKVNATAYLDLPKTMYAKGDTTGILSLTPESPTQTILKSEPWN